MITFGFPILRRGVGTGKPESNAVSSKMIADSVVVKFFTIIVIGLETGS